VAQNKPGRTSTPNIAAYGQARSAERHIPRLPDRPKFTLTQAHPVTSFVTRQPFGVKVV
jgi:hypothetical protein